MINRDNHQVVKEFLAYEAEVLLRDPETISRKRLWLRHVLRWADETDFHRAPDIRPVFPRYLETAGRAEKNGKPLVAVGIIRGCQEARMLFRWLHETNPRQYSSLSATWIDTIQPPPLPDEPPQEHEMVTLEMIRALLAVKANGPDLVLKRDQAAAAFLFLSGARGSAFCTLTRACVNIAERAVKQYPTMGVHTKKKKAADTFLLEIPDLIQVVADWDAFIGERLPPTAPWYPVIDIVLGEQCLTSVQPGRFRVNGLAKNIRALFKRAGLPPMSPHKFRHGNAVYGLKEAKDMSEFKAVSMNLMHSSIGITDSIYAKLTVQDLRERIARLGQGTPQADVSKDQIKTVLQSLLSQLDSGSISG